MERISRELEEEKKNKQIEKNQKSNQLKQEYSQFLQKQKEDLEYRKEKRINKFDNWDTEKFKIGTGNRKRVLNVNEPYQREAPIDEHEHYQSGLQLNTQTLQRNNNQNFNIIYILMIILISQASIIAIRVNDFI